MHFVLWFSICACWNVCIFRVEPQAQGPQILKSSVRATRKMQTFQQAQIENPKTKCIGQCFYLFFIWILYGQLYKILVLALF